MLCFRQSFGPFYKSSTYHTTNARLNQTKANSSMTNIEKITTQQPHCLCGNTLKWVNRLATFQPSSSLSLSWPECMCVKLCFDTNTHYHKKKGRSLNGFKSSNHESYWCFCVCGNKIKNAHTHSCRARSDSREFSLLTQQSQFFRGVVAWTGIR